MSNINSSVVADDHPFQSITIRGDLVDLYLPCILKLCKKHQRRFNELPLKIAEFQITTARPIIAALDCEEYDLALKLTKRFNGKYSLECVNILNHLFFIKDENEVRLQISRHVSQLANWQDHVKVLSKYCNDPSNEQFLLEIINADNKCYYDMGKTIMMVKKLGHVKGLLDALRTKILCSSLFHTDNRYFVENVIELAHTIKNDEEGLWKDMIPNTITSQVLAEKVLKRCLTPQGAPNILLSFSHLFSDDEFEGHVKEHVIKNEIDFVRSAMRLSIEGAKMEIIFALLAKSKYVNKYSIFWQMMLKDLTRFSKYVKYFINPEIRNDILIPLFKTSPRLSIEDFRVTLNLFCENDAECVNDFLTWCLLIGFEEEYVNLCLENGADLAKVGLVEYSFINPRHSDEFVWKLINFTENPSETANCVKQIIAQIVSDHTGKPQPVSIQLKRDEALMSAIDNLSAEFQETEGEEDK